MTDAVDFARGLSDLRAQLALLLASIPDLGSADIRLPHPFSNMSRESWREGIELWRKDGLSLLFAQPPRRCPTCDGSAADKLFESYDGYPYVECRNCRTWYVPFLVDHDLFERYFERRPEARKYGDYTASQVEVEETVKADEARFRPYYSELRELLPPGPSLDIGCGVGNSLEAANSAGFDAFGLEVNSTALKLAAERGRRVSPRFEDGSDKPYVLVSLWETLEHLNDPLSVLRAARERMAHESILAITVPNLNSPAIRSMRGDSLHIHGGPAWPGHINLWNEAQLRLLLELAGFEVIDCMGQFSANIPELVSYHLGLWRGARDYLSDAEPQVALPRPLAEALDAIAPAAVFAEAELSLGPILKVFARPNSGRDSTKLTSLRRQRRSEQLKALGLDQLRSSPLPKGRALNLHEAPSYVAPIVKRTEPYGLDILGHPEGPFAYLWNSEARPLNANTWVAVRGKIRSGGLSVGLLCEGAWAATACVEKHGVFEATVRAPKEASYAIVLSAHDPHARGVDAAVDQIELIEP